MFDNSFFFIFITLYKYKFKHYYVYNIAVRTTSNFYVQTVKQVYGHFAAEKNCCNEDFMGSKPNTSGYIMYAVVKEGISRITQSIQQIVTDTLLTH